MADAKLEELVNGDHRAAENIARNEYRHPVETLEFFGLRPDMTVLEMLPARGWYTEVLAPYLPTGDNFVLHIFAERARGLYGAGA